MAASGKDIIAYLLAGGSYDAIKGKVSKGQLTAALLADPTAVGKLQAMAATATSKYTKYNPTELYDPAQSMNDVEFKYSAMEPKFQPLVKDYFAVVRASGGNLSRIAEAKAKMNAGKYGLDEGSYNSLIDQLSKDTNNFSTAEGKRQKANMAAFQAKRKALGIVGVPTDPVKQHVLSDAYLGATTGVYGIGSASTTVEGLAKRKGKKFADSLIKQGKDPAYADKMRTEFENRFVTTLKKKKTNPLDYFATTVTKRTILGE